MGFLINVAPSQQPAIPAWVDTSCSACGTSEWAAALQPEFVGSGRHVCCV